MDYVQLTLLLSTGIIAGVLGGMLGIGGSVIMLPAMVWILQPASGPDKIHQFMAAAMIVNLLLSIPAVLAHARNKAIWPKVVKLLAIGGLVGVVLGVTISGFFTGDQAKYVRWFLGVFLLYVGLENIYKVFFVPAKERATREQVEAAHAGKKVGIGLAVGTLSGFTGLGAGVLAVPVQQYVLNSPLRNAIANSSALIVCMSWLGAIVKNVQVVQAGTGTVTQSLIITACLAPTAMMFSYVGGHLTHRLPTRLVRFIFGLMLIASTWKLLKDMVMLIVGAL